jgi:hypothetical protein
MKQQVQSLRKFLKWDSGVLFPEVKSKGRTRRQPEQALTSWRAVAHRHGLGNSLLALTICTSCVTITRQEERWDAERPQ